MLGAVVDVPPDWVDKSMIAYALGELPGSGVAPNVVVTRDVLGIDLPEPPHRITRFAENHLALMHDQLRDLVVLDKHAVIVGQWLAARLVVSWLAQHVAITQTIVFIETAPTQALIATGTCASADYHRFGATLDAIIASLRPGG